MENTKLYKPVYLQSQYPLDIKVWATNVLELVDLGVNNEKAFSYYSGMFAYDMGTNNIYRWVQWDSSNVIQGLIPGGYTYPSCHKNDLYDYSDKTFNFVLTNINLAGEELYDEALWAKIGTGQGDMFDTITEAANVGFNHFYFTQSYIWDGNENENDLPDKCYFSGENFIINNSFILNKDFVFIDIHLLSTNGTTNFNIHNLEAHRTTISNLELTIDGTILIKDSIINEIIVSGTLIKNIFTSTITTFRTTIGTQFNNIIDSEFTHWSPVETLSLDRFIRNFISTNITYLPTGKYIQFNNFNILNSNTHTLTIPSHGRVTNNNFGSIGTLTLLPTTYSYFTQNNGDTLVINDTGSCLVNNNYFGTITDNRGVGNILSFPLIASDITVTDGSNSNVELLARKITDILASVTPTTDYATVAAIRAYVDNRVTGALHYVGTINASTGIYPVIGSGSSNEVLKGDTYIVNVAGSLGGNAFQIGDFIIANINTPGQTSGNWDNVNSNITYIPEDTDNKVTSISIASTDIEYPSAKTVYDELELKENVSNKTLIVNSSSTDTEYPSAKAVYDALGTIDVSDGIYVPVATNVNHGTVYPISAIYSRVLNTVTVTIKGMFNPTVTGTMTFNLSVPIPTVFTTLHDVIGSIITIDEIPGSVFTNTTNHTIAIEINITNDNVQDFVVHCQYIIKS